MGATVTSEWSDERCVAGRIPRSATIKTGRLFVPSHLPAYRLDLLENIYRNVLWPPCRHLGRLRLSREFRWDNDGRTLLYRIIDVPDQEHR